MDDISYNKIIKKQDYTSRLSWTNWKYLWQIAEDANVTPLTSTEINFLSSTLEGSHTWAYDDTKRPTKFILKEKKYFEFLKKVYNNNNYIYLGLLIVSHVDDVTIQRK